MSEFGNSVTSILEYNDLIANKVLDNIDRGILGLPQPTMFGGKRMRKFVLPASTEYDYPSSLSVGNLGTAQPDMLGGSFWNDFGKGFKQGVSGVAQVATPIVKEVGTELAKDALRSYMKGEGTKKGQMRKTARRAYEGGFLIGADGHGINNVTELANHPTYTGGVHSGAGVFDTFSKGFKQVGHALAPVAEEILHDVVIPEGKDYLKKQIKERKGGSKNSGLIRKIIGSRNPSFDINRIKRPSGNLISYGNKMGEKYTGSYKPNDMWNTFKGKNVPKKKGSKKKPELIIEEDEEEFEITPKPKAKKAPKKNLVIEEDSEEEENVEIPLTKKQIEENRKKMAQQTRAYNKKLNARAKKLAVGKTNPLPKGQMDIRTALQGKGMYGGSVLDDIGKVSQAVAPFLPILMGLGRGEVLPPHPKGGNWADDLGKISNIVAPFAPLMMAMGRDEMCGGDVLGDIGKVTQAVAPFLPLLMGLGRAKRKQPRGGALIMDNPAQFKINTGVMPPALASYNPPRPSTSGSGRKPSERGAIVKRIMAEKGMSLPQASKYVKEHGLYKK